jgi:hypothetical protein
MTNKILTLRGFSAAILSYMLLPFLARKMARNFFEITTEPHLHLEEYVEALADALGALLMRLPAEDGMVAEPEPLLLLVRDEELVELLAAELHLVLAVLGQRLLVRDRVVLRPGIESVCL